MLSNREIKFQAQPLTTKNWWTIALISIIFSIPTMVLPQNLALIGSIFSIFGGYFLMKAILAIVRTDEKVQILDVFKSWDSQQFISYLSTSLLSGLYVFLWFLIPLAGLILGPMKSFSYFLAPYMAMDNPEKAAGDNITLSKELMEGYKGQNFMLELSFFFWILGVIVTFGLLGLYVIPYMNISMALFYIHRMNKQPDETQSV